MARYVSLVNHRIYGTQRGAVIIRPLHGELRSNSGAYVLQLNSKKASVLTWDIKMSYRMNLKAVQTLCPSAGLQKDQCTLHTPNCKNANIMTSQMCSFTIYWLGRLCSAVLWLAFSPRDSSDIYKHVFSYLQSSYLHKYSTDRQGKKNNKKPPKSFKPSTILI